MGRGVVGGRVLILTGLVVSSSTCSGWLLACTLFLTTTLRLGGLVTWEELPGCLEITGIW